MSKIVSVCHGSPYRRGTPTQPWYSASHIKVLAGGAGNRLLSRSGFPVAFSAPPTDPPSKDPRPPVLVAARGCVLQERAPRTACEAKATIKNYLLVAKPGIVLGNLISAAAGFFLASKGRIDGVALAATLIGISLVVASGCVFNNCIDSKIDRKMARTRNRALANGLISVEIAVSYATILAAAGMALLWVAANPLAVFIVLAGLGIYVVVYSLYMKRNSVYSSLIGSLAGAAPPLAGYCAVTGRFDLGALILLAIFSLWQMPHCYAIAVYRLDDYSAARIPVLPVKQGTAAARRHIIGWILPFMAATLTLTFAGYTGYSFFAVATVLCVLWLYMAWSGHNASDERLWAKRLFIFSVLTISILSVMMSIDFT
jgi:protoheme IX farnesyltransferase